MAVKLIVVALPDCCLSCSHATWAADSRMSCKHHPSLAAPGSIFEANLCNQGYERRVGY